MSKLYIFLCISFVLLLFTFKHDFNFSRAAVTANTFNPTLYYPFNSYKFTFRVFFIKKFFKCRISYSSNNSSSFNPTLLLMSGDIELNPGPTAKSKVKCPVCTECKIRIVKNIASSFCSKCDSKIHLRCKPNNNFVCSNCLTMNNLPFADSSLNSSFISNSSFNASSSFTDNSCILLQQHNVKNLKIMHFNIRSLYKNIDNLKEYLTLYNYTPDIILLSETWIQAKFNNHISSISIPNYTFISSSRDWSRGGGVGIYIKLGINYKKIHKLSANLPKTFEHLLINVKGSTANSKVTVGVLYRPPNSKINDWFENFQTLHQSLCSSKTSDFILGGDFNINLLQKNNSSTTFSNILSSLDLQQTITEPTRIYKNTTSLLDLFITNNPSQIISSNVLKHDAITDHESIYVIYKLNQPKFIPTTKIIRSTKHFNLDYFLFDFQNLPFNTIYLDCNPVNMLTNFTSLIKSVIDKHAPLTKINITQPPAPWINKNIKKQIHVRNSLHRKYKTNQLPEIFLKYTTLKKQIKFNLSLAKQNFITKCLQNPSTKGVWNVINRLLKPSSNSIKHDINRLNEHFINTSERILGRVPSSTKSLHFNSQGNFCFSTVSIDTVLYHLNKMKTDSATGSDLIPARFIKPAASIIAPHLTNIINICISNNIFPKSWKTSRISPIPKIDNPTEFDHYRPISILPSLSKILEKIIAKQLIQHMEDSNYFPSTLSGCREGHSTTTALLHIKENCIKALKSSELTILTLIDFSKAFDTVNHSKLLTMLSNYNFSNSSITFLQSYLSDRTQYIEYNNNSSDILNINSGVPQGSILGPILFNIYIASINDNLSKSGVTTVNYVDDFQLAISGPISNIDALISKTAVALDDIKTSSNNIDLILNTEKTNFLLISSKIQSNKIAPISNISFNSNKSSISRVSEQKNLGIIFDDHLSFSLHHTQTLKSCYAILHSLKSLKHSLSITNKRILITSLIFNKLYYGNVITHPLNSYWSTKYNTLFKTSLSFIYNKFIHTSEMNSFKFLNPLNTWKLNILQLTFKSIYHKKFPSHLKLCTKPPSSFNLRSDSAIHLPTLLADNSFPSTASTLFNALPSDIRNNSSTQNIKQFSHTIKQLLLDSQNT
jgi:hypothetical protein